MRRVVVLSALLALALSTAAWAGTISVTNQTGTIAISGMAGTGGLGTVGVSTITSIQSELTSFDGVLEPSKSTSLGYLNFTTGTLASGSISGGGVFNAGGSFTIIGIGKWMASIGAPTKGKVALFTGTWVGPEDWTLTSKVGPKATYTLTGDLSGVLWNGRAVGGLRVVQNFFTYNGQLLLGIGHISVGTTRFVIPEPGTLGLLGTGLLGIAGMFRRKLMGRA